SLGISARDSCQMSICSAAYLRMQIIERLHVGGKEHIEWRALPDLTGQQSGRAKGEPRRDPGLPLEFISQRRRCALQVRRGGDEQRGIWFPGGRTAARRERHQYGCHHT